MNGAYDAAWAVPFVAAQQPVSRLQPARGEKLYADAWLEDTRGSTLKKVSSAALMVCAAVGSFGRYRQKQSRKNDAVRRRARGGEAIQEYGYDQDIQVNLADIVRESWLKIPRERPPMPEDANGCELPYCVPVTLKEMFCFNLKFMSDPVHYTYGKKAPDMKWAMGAFPVFVNVIESVDRPMFGAACRQFEEFVRRQGVSSEQVSLFQKAMFASLRSLLPESWCPMHELAWMWLYASSRRLFQPRWSIKDRSNGHAAMETLARASWAKIRTKQPLSNRPGIQIPMTFAGMAEFNAGVLSTPSWITGEAAITEDMHWTSEFCSSMDKLVKAAGSKTWLRNAEQAGRRLRDQGVSVKAIDEFGLVVMCSMRALLAHEWSVQHEFAWLHYWHNVIMPVIRAEADGTSPSSGNLRFWGGAIWNAGARI